MKVIISIFFREFICTSQRGHFIVPATLNRHTLITPLIRDVSFGGVAGKSPFRNASALASTAVWEGLKDISVLICFRLFRFQIFMLGPAAVT